MKRRLVLATCVLSILGAGAGAALADVHTSGSPTNKYQVCLVLAKNNAGTQTEDFCVDAG